MLSSRTGRTYALKYRSRLRGDHVSEGDVPIGVLVRPRVGELVLDRRVVEDDRAAVVHQPGGVAHCPAADDVGVVPPRAKQLRPGLVDGERGSGVGAGSSRQLLQQIVAQCDLTQRVVDRTDHGADGVSARARRARPALRPGTGAAEQAAAGATSATVAPEEAAAGTTEQAAA
ncbi:hypothetical protein [Paenarthrobacter aurescens]|uniref:hypothetical protein n=1 Tax=Paenarthrobacter aurescens TaxID=43663 RepID=UPI0005C21073|nr:hypothetical protein [Paenarthrobacter aurescens]